jgi:NTE family protein
MTTSLVLGSGGVRGIAHIGVLQALEDHGIEPDFITGSSSGAIIGSLYAAGHDADTIQSLIKDFKAYKFIDFSNLGGGILKGQKAEIFLRDQLGDKTFDDLNTPLVVNALNLNDETVEYLETGDVVEAVHASMAIPGVFQPVKRDGAYLLDAGHVNPLPVDPLPESDQIIISDVTAGKDNIDEDTRFHQVIKEFFNFIQRRQQTTQLNELRDKQGNATITPITPDTKEWNILSLHDLQEIVERGQSAGHDALQ